MKKGLVLLIALAVWAGILGAQAVNAAVPQMINYQGTLTDTTGTPVPNGNYNIEFKIYDVASGGAALWSEQWNTTTSQVAVVGGIFNAMLGFLNPIPETFFIDHPVTYLGIKVGTDSEMLPRQQITSVGYAFTAGNGIPRGGIILWSGAVDQIPAGWALCNGTNGTPDLRDRFVIGAGGGYAVAATGGVNANNISHTHSGPSHAHHIDVAFTSCVGDCTDGASDGSKDVGSDSHGHHLIADTQASGTGTTGAGGSTSLENRPPYYALAFIMKL